MLCANFSILHAADGEAALFEVVAPAHMGEVVVDVAFPGSGVVQFGGAPDGGAVAEAIETVAVAAGGEH